MFVFASALSTPAPPECPHRLEDALDRVSWVLLLLSGATPCSTVDQAQLSLSRLSQRVEIFHLRKERWPTDLREVFGDEEVPRNPWGHAYALVPPLVVGGAPTLVDPGRDGVVGPGCGGRDDEDHRWGWTPGLGYGEVFGGGAR